MIGETSVGYFEFKPEIIIEATMVCDRACPGCYAPNVVSREDPESAIRLRPELFLRPEALCERLSEITASTNRQITSLSFRGGEPSRHPALPALIDLSMRFARRVFVESHAMWALPYPEDAPINVEAIMRALTRPNVALKISFDSMHEMTAHELKDLTEHLYRRRVNWLVAITERDRERFDERRALCDWIPDSKIVRHQKAASASELYMPPLGVIRPDGSILRSLSTRNTF